MWERKIKEDIHYVIPIFLSHIFLFPLLNYS